MQGKPKRANLAKLRKQPGKHHAGHNLALQADKRGSASRIFRYRIGGRERAMGLGPLGLVPMNEVREKAHELRRALKIGKVDPIEGRDAARQAQELERARSITFEECARHYFDTHRPEWRSPKHAEQWQSSLAKYVHPRIGGLPVASINKVLVLQVLQPIWHRIPETANRVRGRLELILDFRSRARLPRGGSKPRDLGG